jgi:hypothetical protein
MLINNKDERIPWQPDVGNILISGTFFFPHVNKNRIYHLAPSSGYSRNCIGKESNF